jgi:acetyl-CoA carboxylase biotin carboxylase subunit
MEKILVANRGEIAVRVIRTAKKLGIRTVAVYSDADKGLLHVEMADEGVYIGESHPTKSYLSIPSLLSAGEKCKVSAVHPGYGFLSENPQFARAVIEKGWIWIGPNPEAIEAMGHKENARKTMASYGVPIAPGGSVEGPESALSFARKIGFPVMVKASLGGGGIGMTKVEREEDLLKALETCRNRARSAFGDESVYLEKYLYRPHHIEVQVIGDSFGNYLVLGERECSVQRRHQKVIEEALSPFLTEEVRKAMYETARAGAQGIRYDNAGTIEFLVDGEKNFYFLEMNTRIQVEHPVTEMITGIDLVELQIRVAHKEPLPVKQEDLRFHGHSIEARVYAEDPKTFFPSPGKLEEFSYPSFEWLRVDTGYRKGDSLTPFYDPLIAKVIVYGETREESISRLKKALRETVIEGVKTNIPFVLKVLENEEFLSGNYTTEIVTKIKP